MRPCAHFLWFSFCIRSIKSTEFTAFNINRKPAKCRVPQLPEIRPAKRL